MLIHVSGGVCKEVLQVFKDVFCEMLMYMKPNINFLSNERFLRNFLYRKMKKILGWS